MATKKPPARVLAISGAHEADVITQDDLMRASQLQAAEWLAANAAHKANLTILNRLKHGAQIETGTLTYDRELRMVRTRKVVGG